MKEFRGKSVRYDGRWFYGRYKRLDPSGAFTRAAIVLEHGIVTPNWVEVIEVYPDTVGQYIYKIDKHGAKIFENDLVKTKYGRICKVAWNDEISGFDLISVAKMDCKAPDEHDFWLSENLEVIGNIFDNEWILNKHSQIN